MPTHTSLASLFTDIADAIRAKLDNPNTRTRVPTSYIAGENIAGTLYQEAIGKGVDTVATTGNDYFQTVQGGSGSTYIEYSFDFSTIPADATIQSISVKVKGHCEDPSQDRQIATVQLYSGSTAKGSSLEITSATDVVYTLTPGTWTVAELQNAKLRFTIGVYGGRISGVTWAVTLTDDGIVADIFPEEITSLPTHYFGTATATPSSNSKTINFTNLNGCPKIFTIFHPITNNSSLPSTRYVLAVFCDGENNSLVSAYESSSGNKYAYYSVDDAFTTNYDNGTFTVTTTSSTTRNFASGKDYRLFYIY